jgi:hypothetical protein
MFQLVPLTLALSDDSHEPPTLIRSGEQRQQYRGHLPDPVTQPEPRVRFFVFQDSPLMWNLTDSSSPSAKPSQM